MKILAIASDRMEFPGILSRAERTSRVGLGIGWAQTAFLGGNELLLAANGAGAGHASALVDRALPVFKADTVVSFGFCGAVRPDLGVGQLVVASAVATADREYPVWPVTSGTGRPVHTGVVRTVDHVVQTAEEKARLRETGASVVEMEAAGVAERASAHRLPFWCVKSVTDLGNETLANDYNRALREDGHFDTIVLLRGTLRQPFVRTRELLRLRERCVQAAGMLGDFFANL